MSNSKRTTKPPAKNNTKNTHPGQAIPLQQQLELVEERHSGPLPAPQTLHLYNQIDGSFAERIVCMAEKEQSHRHNQEDRIVRTETFCKKSGLVCGFLIGLATIGGGFVIVLNGHHWPGVIFGMGGLTGLVSVFVVGDRKKDNKEEAKDNTPEKQPPVIS